MEAARTEWTDKRLDDLKASMDDMKASMDDGFRRVDERFAQVDARFISLERSIHKSFLQIVLGLCGMMFAGFGAVITLIATHS